VISASSSAFIGVAVKLAMRMPPTESTSTVAMASLPEAEFLATSV